MRRPQLNALLIGGLLGALLAGIGLSHLLTETPGPDDEVGLVLQTPRALPDYQLVTHTGEAFSKASRPARWQLMFFGFTHCPDICPSTLALMKQLRKDLPDTTREQLDFVFVSLDPARDTPEVLAPYLAFFDPAIIGLTGSEEAIKAFANAAGIAFVKVGDGDDYMLDHSTALVLLEPGGGIKAYFSAPHRLPELQSALSRLIDA